jgi:histidine ammonia-lyase
MLDAEAATLRHALRTAHREGVGRAYPKSLRQRVVVLRAAGKAAGRSR